MVVHTWEGALCQPIPFPASPYKEMCLVPLSEKRTSMVKLFNGVISSTLPVRMLIDQASRLCLGVSTSPLVTSLTMYCAKEHVSLLTRAVGSCVSESY